MKKSDAVAALAALAHETRLEAFRLLVQAGPEGIAAGRLALRLRLAPPTLSFHLAQLNHAGLVESRRAGRSIIYAANYPAMSRLLSYLTDNCCGGRPEICLPQTCEAPAGRGATSRPTARRPRARTAERSE